MGVEELAKQFAALASKTQLSKSELEEARQLMRNLKEGGLTNEEKLQAGKRKVDAIYCEILYIGYKTGPPHSLG